MKRCEVNRAAKRGLRNKRKASSILPPKPRYCFIPSSCCGHGRTKFGYRGTPRPHRLEMGQVKISTKRISKTPHIHIHNHDRQSATRIALYNRTQTSKLLLILKPVDTLVGGAMAWFAAFTIPLVLAVPAVPRLVTGKRGPPRISVSTLRLPLVLRPALSARSRATTSM